MMKKKNIIAIFSVAIVIVALLAVYSTTMSPTRVAMLNFPDFTVEKMIRSCDNNFIRIGSVPLEDVDDIEDYDFVLVRIHGSSLTGTHLEAIKKAISKGVPVFSTESDNKDINSQKGREQEYLATLMDNESVANYRSLLNYVRKNIDKKLFFNGSYNEPVKVPTDYFFHLGDDNFFATYDEYQKYYEESGRYKENAPRVALLAGNINLQNSNSEHFEALINNLEARGLNVYPINSFGMGRLGMLTAVKPDVIINRPHGRLVMGMADAGTSILKQIGAPILAPVTVSELYEKWLPDAQGMAGGGMATMSVVMPELDGAIAPYAIAAQFDRGGLRIFDEIPVHTDKFCSLVENFAQLRRKQNKDKKVAIYYYKGNGKGALSAADIEGLPSLFNTLNRLKEAGYDLTGLPSDIGTFEEMVQKQGSVLGPYALGAYDEFLKNGNPELVHVDTFAKWTAEILPQPLIDDMEARYGEAPGDYMGVEKGEDKYIAVARLQFGNVVILPQSLPAVGEDTNKIIHGVKGAPAYPYVASYLWTRKGFGADALIHFGTHGSLEFIPGKQMALSDYDWSDVLVGDMPHFYIYTINNIGEGIIAKRRSYATLIDHLTAPFMKSELYDDLRKIQDRIHRFESVEDGAIKEGYRASITEMAAKENIISALGLDSTRNLTDEEIENVHIYVEEINDAKVIDGLYTLGVPYSKENINNTARLISVDPISYGLASVDAAHGRIEREMMDNHVFMKQRYGQITDRTISRAMAGESVNTIMASLVSPEDRALLTETVAAEKVADEKRMAMMRRMMSASSVKQDTLPRFFDDNGNLLPDADTVAVSEEEKAPSQMEKMAKAEPVAFEDDAKDEATRNREELIAALKSLENSISNIETVRRNLAASTQLEQNALLTALNGGYIEPSSAGDPIVNPQALPTGRNFYSINPETTPTEEAWKVGRQLAENLLEAEMDDKGKYPEKVSFTLWSTDFISSEGATVAQILYLLGVEPLRDGFGYIRSLRLIPAEQLGRPRVDVVVQTSGQLRDIASSRLELINRAVRMAAEAGDENGTNYVSKGLKDAERFLLEKGFSPAEARKYSSERIFGGVNGNYGTGIMGLVEQGDSWESRDQIAEQYINNMGAIYSADGGEEWGAMHEGVFEAALLNTSVVVQPRSSNTWGPLSLDHVYEFMGGLSAAVENVTGNDPTAYFNDFRNTSRPKVQGLKEAIGVETNSTVFNPKYIAEMMKGEASAMEHFAETFRNTYGWNSMKPTAIDQHIWNKYYDVYVKDEYNMGLEKTFSEKNPYALEEMTAVMLEAARKGMWKATDAQLHDVAELHTELVTDYEAGCSGFVCDNAKLREFISSKLSPEQAKAYNAGISAAREVRLENADADKSMVLKKDEVAQQSSATDMVQEKSTNYTLYIMVGVVALILVVLIIKHRKKE